MIRNKDADIIRAIKNSCKCNEGDIELIELSVTENGEYIPDEGKAYNKVTVEVEGGGGSGTVNIDDIVLASDLLERCQALVYNESDKATTDWTFSDICTQDSYGILEQAMSDENCCITIDKKPNFSYLSIPPYNQAVIVTYIESDEDRDEYNIYYNPDLSAYEVYKEHIHER